MADDITLNVRVRDMTRGEFNRIRQRMRGMDGDVRRLTRSTNGATDGADRFGRSIRRIEFRLGQFQRSGNLARHEMDFMRRSMGLLGRELRNAAQDGELTEDQFRDLRRELERTRLGFDRLDNEIRRGDAISQRAARAEQQRQRQAAADTRARQREEEAALRAARARAREVAAAARRRAQEEARAEREAARIRDAAIRRRQQQQTREERDRQRRMREAARAALADAQRQAREEERAARDAERVRMAALQRRMQQQQQARREMARVHAAALRDEAQRNRRAEAERQRALRAAAAAQRREVGRLAGLGDDDRGLTLRFRALGEDDMRRMTRGFRNLQGALNGVSGSTDRARRTVRSLGGDLRTMSQALQDAQRSGNITRREFNALSNGLRLTTRDARQLVRSGDLTRSSFRDMRREVSRLRAQLRLLAREGTVFGRLSDRLLLLQRRMRDTRSSAGRVRRTLSRMGEGGVASLRLLTRSISRVGQAFGRFRTFVRNASHGVKIFLLILALIGPLAAPLGALLTTVLGGAFVALGAFALRSEKDIRTAFSRMKSSVGGSVRAAAQPLRASLVFAMGQVTSAVQEMEGALTQAFTATAPLVSNLVGGFTDLAARALPAMTRSLQDMGPVIEGFRAAMGMIGEGIGQLFSAMTSGGGAEGLREAWETAGSEIRDLLVDIGQFINAMSQSQTATALLVAMFETLSALLIVLEGAFKAIDLVLGPLIEKMSELGLTGGLLGVLAKTLETLGLSSSEVKTGLVELGGADREAAREARDHADAVATLTEKLRELNEQNLNRFQAEASLNEAIQTAMENAKELGNTVKINNGIFDTSHENTRKVSQDFFTLAENTTKAIKAAEDGNQPLREQNRLWKEGAAGIRALGEEYNIPKKQIEEYIRLVLDTPEAAKTRLDLEVKQAEDNAKRLKQRIKDVDGKTAKSNARFEAGVAIRNAERMRALQRSIDGIRTSSSHTHTNTTIEQIIRSRIPGPLQKFPASAMGGPLRRAGGGAVQAFPHGGFIQGPGGPTSDSILGMFPSGAEALVSDTEFVVNARQTRKFRPLLEAINSGSIRPGALGLAKGGLTDKQREARRRQREARGELRGQVGIGRFGRVAGFRLTPFEKKLARPDSVGDLVRTLREFRSLIKKATSGRQERQLTRQIDIAGRAFIRHEKRLEKVNKQLDKARDRLQGLQQAAASLKQSVKSGIVGETNITRAATAEDSRVTINTILSQMTGSKENAEEFSRALRQLKKRGLDKGLIAEIAEAGVQGGGLETAQALLGGSRGQIRQLNTMRVQILRAAETTGNTAADAMFGAGIKAGKGLVKGLRKQRKGIKREMLQLAKFMERAIKKALGIRSPSKVMEDIGEFTAEGFALGIRRNNAPSHAMESMLFSTSGGRSAPSGGGGGRPIIVHQTITLDGRVVARQIFNPMREEIAHRGGNVQQALGRG